MGYAAFGIGYGAGYMAKEMRRRRMMREDEALKGRAALRNQDERYGQMTLAQRIKEQDPIYKNQKAQSDMQTEYYEQNPESLPGAVAHRQETRLGEEQSTATAARNNRSSLAQAVLDAEESFFEKVGTFKDLDLAYNEAVSMGLNTTDSKRFKDWVNNRYRPWVTARNKGETGEELDPIGAPPGTAAAPPAKEGPGFLASIGQSVSNWWGASADTQTPPDSTATAAPDTLGATQRDPVADYKMAIRRLKEMGKARTDKEAEEILAQQGFTKPAGL